MSDTGQKTETEVEAKETKSSSYLRFLIIFIIASIPFVGYIIGNSYHEAYLQSFGVSADAFPLSVQNVYIKTYESVTLTFYDATLNVKDKFLKASFFLSFEFLYLAVLTYVVCVAWKYVTTSSNKVAPQEALAEEEVESKVSLFISAFPQAFLIITFIAALPSLLFLLSISFYSLGASQAKEASNKILNEYKNLGCDKYKKDEKWGLCRQLVSADGQTVINEGILVAQDSKRVAFYNRKESVILAIPSGAIIRNKVNPKLAEETK